MARTLLLLLPIVAFGCSNKLSGSISLSEGKFVPTSCQNMARIGQRGVELADDESRRLRLIELPDGSADAYWFEGSSGKGKKLSDCVTLSVQDQKSTVNKVRNVMGKAELDCHRGDDELTGTVTFENCH